MTPRFRVWLLLIAVSVAPVFGQPGGGGPAIVEVAEVVERPVTPTLALPGTAVPLMTSKVASAQQGIVVERHGYYSQQKKKGDVLIRLDSEQAAARLDVARAKLAAEAARLEMLEAGERSQTIAMRKAEVDRARAEHDDAKQNWSRIQELHERKAVSDNEREEARARLEASRAALEAAQAQKDLAVAGSRQEELAVQRAVVAQTRASVQEAEKVVADMAVVAPFDGEVSQVFVEVGDWVSEGGQILELVRIDSLDFTVLVPQHRIGDVQLRETAEIDFESSGETLTLTGTVAAIGPQAMLKGRTVPVIVRFRNPDRKVLSMMSGQVRLPVGETVVRTLLPKDAVVRTAAGGTHVFAVVDGKAEMRQVELGTETGALVEVLSGVKAGETVVIRGNERLRPGSPVAPAGEGTGAPAGGRS